MNSIKKAFDGHFARWGITLPESALQLRHSGNISAEGWKIDYCFGVEVGRVYLDFYSSHRMTNDQLWRIYEDGEMVMLDAIQVFYLADDPEAERAYYAHNKVFYERAKRVSNS